MQTSCAHDSPSSRCSDNDAGSKDIQLQVQIIVNNASCSLDGMLHPDNHGLDATRLSASHLTRSHMLAKCSTPEEKPRYLFDSATAYKLGYPFTSFGQPIAGVPLLMENSPVTLLSLPSFVGTSYPVLANFC